MPTYGGGKVKIGKQIYQTISQYIDKNKGKLNNLYIEPFCGMLGVGIHFMKNKINNNNSLIDFNYSFSDKNQDIILLWKELLYDNLILPKNPITKEEYDKLRKETKSSALRGFYGISCAYSGIFFAGYRTENKNSNQNFFERFKIKINDYINILKPYKDRISFNSTSYEDLKIENNSVIYCDPPYKGNTFKSSFFIDFDHTSFWEKMREWSKNNLVFISEYEAPEDFIAVWEQNVNITHKKVKEKKEKLFVYKFSQFINE
jgi:DNA adenine methylase